MIRNATENDIPAMLAVYKPYVENTTYSFEYDVPCTRSFTQRFYEHTAQFPWLVWEEDGRVLGYRTVTTFRNCGYKQGRWLGVTWMEKELTGAFNPGGFPRKWMDCV